MKIPTLRFLNLVRLICCCFFFFAPMRGAVGAMSPPPAIVFAVLTESAWLVVSLTDITELRARGADSIVPPSLRNYCCCSAIGFTSTSSESKSRLGLQRLLVSIAYLPRSTRILANAIFLSVLSCDNRACASASAAIRRPQ